MGDQRRRRRFAVGAGDRDEGSVRRKQSALAAEQFDIADDLDGDGFRQNNRPMRLGMGQRHAGRQNERRERAPIGGGKIDDRNARCARARSCACVVVPGRHLRAASAKRVRGREAGASEPEQRDLAGFEAADRDHGSPQLQGGEADHREHEGDNPETHDDLRLRPAELFEMMVDRRHAEHAFAGQLE